MFAYYLAEAVRFELTNGFPLPVFKTGAIDHSATPPQPLYSRRSVSRGPITTARGHSEQSFFGMRGPLTAQALKGSGLPCTQTLARSGGDALCVDTEECAQRSAGVTASKAVRAQAGVVTLWRQIGPHRLRHRTDIVRGRNNGASAFGQHLGDIGLCRG